MQLKIQKINLLLDLGRVFSYFWCLRCTSPFPIFPRFSIFRFQPLVLHTYLPPPPRIRKKYSSQTPSRRSQSTMFHSLKSSSSSCMSPGDESLGGQSNHPENQSTSTEHVVVTKRHQKICLPGRNYNSKRPPWLKMDAWKTRKFPFGSRRNLAGANCC